MALPSFTVTGNLYEITGAISGSELAEIAPQALRFVFTPNLESPLVTHNSKLYKIDLVYGGVEADGTIRRATMVNGSPVTAGENIELLAEDSGLNVAGLQWKVQLETPLGGGFYREIASWFINARADGETAHLADEAPVNGVDARTVVNIRTNAYAEDIIDSGATGVELVQADNEDDAWSALGPVPATNRSVPVIKTSAYTAAVGDIVLADASAGAFTVPLPSPSDGVVLWVKKIDSSSNPVLVQRSGTDTFNTASGPSTLQLILPGESVALLYRSGIWTVIAHSLTVPSLDNRYIVRGYHPVAGAYSILDSNGAKSIGIEAAANAVNYWEVINSASGSGLLMRALGNDSNVQMGFRPKGTSPVVIFGGSGATITNFSDNTSAVNYVRIDNSATGNAVKVSALGSDSAVSLNLVPKGSGVIQANGVEVVTTSGSQTLTNKRFGSSILDTNGNAVIALGAASGAVNYLKASNSPTGSGVTLEATGSDTDVSMYLKTQGAGYIILPVTTGVTPKIGVSSPDSNTGLNLTTKGTGVVQANGIEVATLSGTQTLTNKTLTTPRIGQINDSNGNAIIATGVAGSAVNYLKVSNAAAGNPVTLEAAGSDSNIGLYLKSAGNGGVKLAVATGQTPSIGISSPDTDVSLNLVPKGAGRLQANGVTVPTVSSTDTLTNKTLTSPALTTPTLSTSTPASASAAGVAGTIVWDSSYIYICTATNTWKRAALATW